MTLFCGRNDEGFQLWPNTQSLESGFFCFRLFWFFVLPVRVLYSILLLVGSLPCRNPKCATRKNVPAIYIHDMWVTCGLLARERARRRASARAERAIKKNWTLQNLRNFAGRFQMGQTRRVLSGVKKPPVQISAK